MNQLEDIVRDTFAERGDTVAGARFASADVRRRARRLRLRQRASGAAALAVVALAAIVVPQAVRIERSVPAEFLHSDPAYVDWPARGDRIHDRKLLRRAVREIDENGEGPHTRLRLLLAERYRQHGQIVDLVLVMGRDALGRPRIMAAQFGDGNTAGLYTSAPDSSRLTHWLTLLGGPGLLLVTPEATHVEVGGTTYEVGTGVLEIDADVSATVVVRAGNAVLGRGLLHPDPPSDALATDVIDWPNRGTPAPAAVVQAAKAATLAHEGVLPMPHRQLASGRLPDGRVFYAFTAGAPKTSSDRAGWFWVGAADGSVPTSSSSVPAARDVVQIERVDLGGSQRLLAWHVDGYVIFLAQPGIRSAEYTTDGGATYRPAPHVDGLGVLDVRGVQVTDAAEIRVRVLDFPGCATYTWASRWAGLTAQYCDRYADAYQQ